MDKIKRIFIDMKQDIQEKRRRKYFKEDIRKEKRGYKKYESETKTK